MSKALRIVIFTILIIAPVTFYFFLHQGDQRLSVVKHPVSRPADDQQPEGDLPKIALVFDDLGESLKEIKQVYSLDVPLSVAVIPGLKFSKNIAHIGARCGFSILIHLPMEPRAKTKFRTDKYRFVSASLKKRALDSLLRYYLNSIKIAIGVNNHMGSRATEDPQLMRAVMKELKQRELLFIDSRTSLKSVAYDAARQAGLRAGFSEGFLDSVDDPRAITVKIEQLVARAKEKGKIIIIAHPKPNTFRVLKKKLPSLKTKVEFVTITDYFTE